MVLLDLKNAARARFGDIEAKRIMVANQLVWEKPDAGIDPTLEAAYNFEEDYGTLTFLDYSSKGRDVTLTDIQQRTESFSNNGTHAAKRGAVIAGGSSGVAVADYNAMASRTVEGWFAYYLFTGTWLMRWHSTPMDSGVFGLYYAAGALNARVKKGGVNYNATFSVSPVVNTWYHVAQTYDAVTGVNRLYIGGVLRASATVPGGGTLDAASFIDLAGDGTAPNSDTASGGAVDDFRTYSRALTAEEIVTDMGTLIG